MSDKDVLLQSLFKGDGDERIANEATVGIDLVNRQNDEFDGLVVEVPLRCGSNTSTASSEENPVSKTH